MREKDPQALENRRRVNQPLVREQGRTPERARLCSRPGEAPNGQYGGGPVRETKDRVAEE